MYISSFVINMVTSSNQKCIFVAQAVLLRNASIQKVKSDTAS